MNINWNPEKATLLLDLAEITIPYNVINYAEKNGYIIKNSFHLTVLSFQNGKKLLELNNKNLLDSIVSLTESFDWSILFLPEYFVLERTIPEFVLNGYVQTPRHTRRSIIQKVSVPAYDNFFKKVSEISGITFETPIAHVTLFSWSDYEPEMGSGIALNSQADFEKYRVTNTVL